MFGVGKVGCGYNRLKQVLDTASCLKPVVPLWVLDRIEQDFFYN